MTTLLERLKALSENAVPPNEPFIVIPKSDLDQLLAVFEAAWWVRKRRDHNGNADTIELWARNQQLDDALSAVLVRDGK